MNKDNIIKGLFAIGIVGIIFAVTFLVTNLDFAKKEEFSIETKKSDLVSKDPKITAANFIVANGTIGNLEEKTEQQIIGGEINLNPEMRLEALDIAKTAIINDSPIITGREIEASLRKDGLFPNFYSIRDLKVSEPYSPKTLVINHDEIGQVEYDSVKVNVDFKSVETTLAWPTDVHLNAKITQKEVVDSFKNIAVELVKDGDLWYVYDVEDMEYALNVRMATWSGQGKYDVSADDAVVKEYDIDNVDLFLERRMKYISENQYEMKED